MSYCTKMPSSFLTKKKVRWSLGENKEPACCRNRERTKRREVMATTNKVFVLYSDLRETKVGSCLHCTDRKREAQRS